MSQGKDPTVNSTAPMQQSQGGDKEKTEIVSCWAKFRPWEDWRGEYGFDWLREGPDDYKEEYSVGSTSPFDDKVEEDKPFEYLYGAKDVQSVTYRMKKSKDGGIWTYSLVSTDRSNGDESANNCEIRMHFDNDDGRRMFYCVKRKDNNISLLGSEKELFYPIYDVEINKDTRYRENRIGAKANSYEFEKPAKTVSFEANDCSFKFVYSYQSDSPFPLPGLAFGETSPVPILVRVTVTKKVKMAPTNNNDTKNKSNNKSSKHRKKNNKQQPKEEPQYVTKTIIYDYDFIKEKIRPSYSDRDNWFLQKEIAKRDKFSNLVLDDDGNKIMIKNTEYTDPDQFWKECIGNDEKAFNDLLHYVNVDIAHLSKNESFDDIIIDVNGPTKLIMDFQLTEEYGLTIEGKKRFWYGQEVISWKQALAETFRKKNTLLIDKDGNIVMDDKTGEPKEYRIPVLSIGCFEAKTTSFGFRWGDTWTPHTDPMEISKGIPLQVNIEGEVPDEVTFVTDNPDVLKVDPPKKVKKEFSITLHPTLPTKGCEVRVIAKGKTKNSDYKEIGELRVLIQERLGLSVYFIKVNMNGKKFSSDYDKAIEEQKLALQNALYQAGIELHTDSFEINTKESDLSKIKCMDGVTTTFLEKLFIERYDNVENGTFKGHRFHILNFLLPISFNSCDNEELKKAAAFTPSGSSQTFISNSIVKNRRSAFTVAHEVGHALGLTHSFQMCNTNNISDFSFRYMKTSNIMDYTTSNDDNGITYSLRQYQWKRMRKNAIAHNLEILWQIMKFKAQNNNPNKQ